MPWLLGSSRAPTKSPRAGSRVSETAPSKSRSNERYVRANEGSPSCASESPLCASHRSTSTPMLRDLLGDLPDVVDRQGEGLVVHPALSTSVASGLSINDPRLSTRDLSDRPRPS